MVPLVPISTGVPAAISSGASVAVVLEMLMLARLVSRRLVDEEKCICILPR